MSNRQARLTELEDLLGYRFADLDLLSQALRHGSAAIDTDLESYERLEFLGDAVLGNAMALILFDAFPDGDQGVLTRMRAHLTRAATLAQKASLLGLDGYVELGPSEEATHGRERFSLLEDILEAIIGAIMLDGGWDAALHFVRRHFGPELDELDERTLVMADAKTALQEAAQGRGLPLPHYREVGSSGPDHRRRWAFEVEWDGEDVARGEGPTKRDAQQQAARRALRRLGLVPEEG
jgi:ribonuclease-3